MCSQRRLPCAYVACRRTPSVQIQSNVQMPSDVEECASANGSCIQGHFHQDVAHRLNILQRSLPLQCAAEDLLSQNYAGTLVSFALDRVWVDSQHTRAVFDARRRLSHPFAFPEDLSVPRFRVSPRMSLENIPRCRPRPLTDPAGKTGSPLFVAAGRKKKRSASCRANI